MSFIKLNDQIHSNFFTVAESDCQSCGEYGQLSVQHDGEAWPEDIVLFKSREDAGQYVRDYWEDYIDSESSDEVGRLAGPGSVKVRSLQEWLDLYLDVPEEHFEEEYSVEAIGENLVEILGFKPVVAFSRGQ